MSAPEFAVGEVVRVTIAARFRGCVNEMLDFVIGDGDTLWLCPDMPGVTVERVGPAGWPPQAGDVWKDSNDEEWFASTRTATSPVELFLADFSSSMAMEPDDLAEKFGPVRLVRRRETP